MSTTVQTKTFVTRVSGTKNRSNTHEGGLAVVQGAFNLQQEFAQLLAQFQQQQFVATEQTAERILQQLPNHAPTLNILAAVFGQRKLYDRALSLANQALAIDGKNAAYYSNRGLILMHLKLRQAGLSDQNQAVALQESFAAGHYNRALLLMEESDKRASLAAFNRAYDLGMRSAELLMNRGLMQLALQDARAAQASLEEGARVAPRDVKIPWNLAIVHLTLGQFEQGWPLYEYRWQQEGVSLPLSMDKKPWLGQTPIAGKTILLCPEQGLGDSLQFCRYATLLHDRGARVLLGVPEPLVSVMQSLAGVAEIVPLVLQASQFDEYTPLLSLPLALGTRLESIPAPSSYLRAPPEALQKWSARLGIKPQGKRRIGLVWSGSTVHKNDTRRSVPLEKILPYLPADAQYYCLQKEIRDGDKAAMQTQGIADYSSEITDFGDTAALCMLMDCVISVDTSVAHLAGALGCDTRILIASNPDWRWMLERSDSPWYPTARLYRQAVGESWEQTLARLGAKLFLGLT